MRTAPMLLLALALAGCAAPGGGHAHAGLDTGDIAPGAEKTLGFDHAGTFVLHCHPHPFMEHAVTVTDDGPAAAHVHILDGDDAGAYRFEPARVALGAGGVVTYHNHGNLTHTATEG